MLAFRLGSDEVASTLKLAIQHEEDLVVSASAFVASHPHVRRGAFDRWVESVHAIQRYPELQNIGLVNYVPASDVGGVPGGDGGPPAAALRRRLGRSAGKRNRPAPACTRITALPSAGLARSPRSYVPAGLDYCVFAPALEGSRDSGEANFAPFSDGADDRLSPSRRRSIEGDVVPRTIAARRRNFVGWLGELLVPGVVLSRALAGPPERRGHVPLQRAPPARDVPERKGPASRADDVDQPAQRLDRADVRAAHHVGDPQRRLRADAPDRRRAPVPDVRAARDGARYESKAGARPRQREDPRALAPGAARHPHRPAESRARDRPRRTAHRAHVP